MCRIFLNKKKIRWSKHDEYFVFVFCMMCDKKKQKKMYFLGRDGGEVRGRRREIKQSAKVMFLSYKMQCLFNQKK